MKNGKRKKLKKEPITGKWFWVISMALICVSSFSLYHKAIDNEALDLDDVVINIANYPFLTDISNAPKVFTQSVFHVQGENDTAVSFYRPMMILSFMMDAQISPSPPKHPSLKPFFTANIFYHTGACILLLLLLIELNIPPIASLLLTLIFTVHPLLNQAVAWIPGRNDSLLAVFILLSFLFLLKYLQSKKTNQFILHILFFVFALFTKENAIMLIPLAFILLQFVLKEPFSKGNYKKLGISYLICVIPWLLIRHYALRYNRIGSGPLQALHDFLINTPYLLQYVGKALFPFNLSVMSTAADTNYVVALLALALFCIFIFISKEKNKGLLLFGTAWYLLFFVLTFFSYLTGLEHRAYLPMIGIVIVVSQFDMVKKAEIASADAKGLAGVIMLLAVFVVFYIVSSSRLPIFQNRFNFYKSAMETSPTTTLPCKKLSDQYVLAGDYKAAIAVCMEALKRDSTSIGMYNDVAGIYIDMKMYPEAEKELNIEIAKHPSNNIAVFNLGFVVLKEYNDYPDCIILLKKAISMDSAFLQPYHALSGVYQSMGDSANAVLYQNLYIKKTPKR